MMNVLYFALLLFGVRMDCLIWLSYGVIIIIIIKVAFNLSCKAFYLTLTRYSTPLQLNFPQTNFNLLGPELFFLILAHPVYKI